MSALESRAEVLKLERLLEADLGFLEGADSDDLRVLRDQVTDVLFEGDRDVLQRIAAAGGKLPVGLVAASARHAFGPLLSARVTGLMDPGRAEEVARHLPPEFLADLACHLDPRRATAVISRMPAESVVAVAAELDARGEHVAMGRFVAHLTDDALSGCLRELGDASILRTAFVLEGKDRLDHLVELLPHGRLEGMIAAAGREELWPEALDLVGHLAEERQVDVARLTARQDPKLLDGLVRAAQEHGLWEDVLSLVARMDPDERARLAHLRSVHGVRVLRSIVQTTATCELWDALLPLVEELPPATRRKASELIAEIDPARVPA